MEKWIRLSEEASIRIGIAARKYQKMPSGLIGFVKLGFDLIAAGGLLSAPHSAKSEQKKNCFARHLVY